jgi:hypothetical protein
MLSECAGLVRGVETCLDRFRQLGSDAHRAMGMTLSKRRSALFNAMAAEDSHLSCPRMSCPRKSV